MLMHMFNEHLFYIMVVIIGIGLKHTVIILGTMKMWTQLSYIYSLLICGRKPNPIYTIWHAL
jgi:hypothetical protein